LEAVRQDGLVIEHIESPSEEVRLEAVRQLEAVGQNGRAIKHIKKLAAVRKDSWAIEFIKDPSEAVQLEVMLEVMKWCGLVGSTGHNLNDENDRRGGRRQGAGPQPRFPSRKL
jgi:hypothetical protein